MGVMSPTAQIGLILRIGRDSNSRAAEATNGFRDRRNRPLCHLSVAALHITFRTDYNSFTVLSKTIFLLQIYS